MDKKEIQKQEAIRRLKLLETEHKLFHTVRENFEESSRVNVSEDGILFWIDQAYTPLYKKVKWFEKKYDSLVYHVIRSDYVELGTMYSFLYVSPYFDEWEIDREDLQDGYPIAYVWNVTDDDLSEFGSIGIKGKFGGLIRTA